MSKRKIHFIYSVPLPQSLIRRGIDKAISLTGVIPPLYRGGSDYFIPWRQPVRAPHSISYHILRALRMHGDVRYYSMYEERTIHLGEDDILLGVPAQEHEPVPWTRPNEKTIMVRTLKANPYHKHSYIIMPYSNEPHFVRWADELVHDYGKNLLLFAGKLWFDQWDQSPWSKYPIQRKVRLEMGIDANDYPHIKHTYNDRGKRGFLYVGHTAWYKNINQLVAIAKAMPGHKFGHIGLGHIDGWEQIADFADLNRAFMSDVAKDYDCFVNVSADAQVTTVLEQMCFGMYVACTPESGYSYPTLLPLRMHDTRYNVQQLQHFQNLEEKEIKQTTAKNRELAISKHNWKQLCDTVVKFLELT